MSNYSLEIGQITKNYPFGYGYCQCGCGEKTFQYSFGTFRKYLPFHRMQRLAKKSNEKIQKIDRSILTKETLERMYLIENKSPREIANIFNCSDKSITKILKEYSISIRSRSEARLAAIKEGKIHGHTFNEIDESFFSVWTAQMAWMLGLIYTDGYMRGNNVRLAMNDIDVLEKFRKHLKYTGEINKRKNGSNEIFMIDIHRENIAKDLIRLGVHQAKSFTIKFPDMPRDMLRHFIRGCWDGDGGYQFSESNISAHYTSGSYEFLVKLSEILYENGVYRESLKQPKSLSWEDWLLQKRELRMKYTNGKYPVTIHKRGKQNAFDLRISNPVALINLYHYLYDNVDESICMNRKYEKFSCIIKRLND